MTVEALHEDDYLRIYDGIRAARTRIDEARHAAGRADSVTLELAVKTRTPGQCAAAASILDQLGLPVLLGHNRVQEAKETVGAIRRVSSSRIHLIGPLQSNKINQALSCVDVIESIDSPALVAKIDARARNTLPVFIQVNVSGEDSKHGCMPKSVPSVVDAIVSSAHLHLAGFMTVGLNSRQENEVRAGYAHLYQLREAAARRLDIPAHSLALSMGMSGDIEWAIAEGATIVRMGTAVFGPREYPQG